MKASRKCIFILLYVIFTVFLTNDDSKMIMYMFSLHMNSAVFQNDQFLKVIITTKQLAYCMFNRMGTLL